MNVRIDVLAVNGKPCSFRYRRRWYTVTGIQDMWRDVGEWWTGEGEKTFWRVACREKMFELYWDAKLEQWFMYKVWD